MKKWNKKVFSVVILLLLTQASIGQNYGCNTDEMHQHLFATQPSLQQKIIENNRSLELFTQQFEQNYNSQNKGVISYTIPVVFHIIHNNGEENVSKAQVLDGLRILNEAYQKRNPDTANLIQPFKAIAADCEIEFKLAQIDPDGNCTSGITRHVDSSTNSGYHHVKDIVHWNPSMYLNIYICKQAAGLAGHALVPSAADTIPQWDGIVLQHSYLGSIGTSNLTRSVVLPHEVGHYLNLQHVWGGNNVPNFPYLPVGDAGNCAYDDGVTDTPNTIGNTSQNLNATSCGSLDNVQNFMEYSYLNSMFTEGQKIRMHAALNSPIANRNNLWTQANLIATGTDANAQFCAVDFSSDKKHICQGDSVLYVDESYHGITSRTWYFEGGNPITSTDSAVYVTYPNAGTYNVKLVVSNGSQTDSLESNNYVEVFEQTSPRTALLEGFDWATTLANSNWYADDFSTTWQINSTVGKNSSQSVWIDNAHLFKGQKTNLISKPVDASNYANAILSFDYAYAKKTATSSDRIKVYVSKNCGQTWLLRKTITTTNLATTTNFVTTDFVPTEQEWKHVEITNINSAYFVSNLVVKIELQSGGGNNVYIDNINLLDPARVGMEEESQSFSIYPNPAKGSIRIEQKGKANELVIYNVLGEEVLRQVLQNKIENIAINRLASGCYFVQIGESRVKLIVE